MSGKETCSETINFGLKAIVRYIFVCGIRCTYATVYTTTSHRRWQSDLKIQVGRLSVRRRSILSRLFSNYHGKWLIGTIFWLHQFLILFCVGRFQSDYGSHEYWPRWCFSRVSFSTDSQPLKICYANHGFGTLKRFCHYRFL